MWSSGGLKILKIIESLILIPNMTYLHGKNMWVIFEVTGDLGGHLEVRCGHLEGLKYPKSLSLTEPVILIPNMTYLHVKNFEVTG